MWSAGVGCGWVVVIGVRYVVVGSPELVRSRKCVPMVFAAENPPAQGQ